MKERFTKGDRKMANKQKKRCSTLLVMTKMHTETIRCHYIPIRMAKITKKLRVITILSYWRKVILAQLFPTLCNSLDFSPPGSSVHGILQLRILPWVALSFSRGSFQPRDRTQVSHSAGRLFTV